MHAHRHVHALHAGSKTPDRVSGHRAINRTLASKILGGPAGTCAEGRRTSRRSGDVHTARHPVRAPVLGTSIRARAPPPTPHARGRDDAHLASRRHRGAGPTQAPSSRWPPNGPRTRLAIVGYRPPLPEKHPTSVWVPQGDSDVPPSPSRRLDKPGGKVGAFVPSSTGATAHGTKQPAWYASPGLGKHTTMPPPSSGARASSFGSDPG